MDAMKNRLTIIRGLPGSGKSTFAKANYSCLILENDMFHMHGGKYEWSKESMPKAVGWCMKTCREALRNGMDVVVCNMFTKRVFVDSYRNVAEDEGADFEVIRCTGDFRSVHDVPKFVLESMKNGFEDYEGERIVL